MLSLFCLHSRYLVPIVWRRQLLDDVMNAHQAFLISRNRHGLLQRWRRKGEDRIGKLLINFSSTNPSNLPPKPSIMHHVKEDQLLSVLKRFSPTFKWRCWRPPACKSCVLLLISGPSQGWLIHVTYQGRKQTPPLLLLLLPAFQK